MASTPNTSLSDNIICDCTGTTSQKIQQLIDDGADTLEQIAKATGASTGCGACDILILAMLETTLS